MRTLTTLVPVCAGALLLATIASSAQPSDAQAKVIDVGLSPLDPLIGSWTGSGFLRAGPDGPELPHDCTWTIARSHAGQFLRLEFIATSDTARRHWVGYFTFDPAEDQYTTMWKSLDNHYEFHETGSFDPETRALTLTSFQNHGEGKERVEVRSIFTIDSDDAFNVLDSTKDPDTGQWYETFSFTLTRSDP